MIPNVQVYTVYARLVPIVTLKRRYPFAEGAPPAMAQTAMPRKARTCWAS